MKIAFTHNLQLTHSEDEAEFDSPETVAAVADALQAAGHEVERIEVSGPASHLAARLEAFAPDLIFNTAEGRRGRAREAFYPALFENLGFPYTGSDAWALTVTLDKWLTKQHLGAHGVDSPRGLLLVPSEPPSQTANLVANLASGLALPAIVKPNYEGSSKGIGDEAVARDPKALRTLATRALEQYPLGVLVEEFVPGTDVSVPFVEGVGEGVLMPVEYVIDPAARSKFNLYDYRLKHVDAGQVQARCPAELPRDVTARLRSITRQVVRTLGLRDLARVDFRLGDDGRLYLLDVNALPSLGLRSELLVATRRENLSYEATIAAIVQSAALRWKLAVPPSTKPRRASERLRVGFTFNMKRVDTKGGNDAEAEYDAPLTIDAIREAIESFGHDVVLLEANSELPAKLMEHPVDLVFNIAEGLSGRAREAAVPALCDLVGIPYTGSDSATLSLALDKALTKRILRQNGVLTADFQVMVTGREKLHPSLRFPLIVKPNAEGSSKGVAARQVVDDEAALRNVVRGLIERYRQPMLIEEYLVGREFTVGLLGERRPRVLPPMEIVFKDTSNPRPVYDFDVKQEWEKHVRYECPAHLTPTELRAIERAARETFLALDCRDVARVDLRMKPNGEVYVIEINPLPGLTPDYSDLVLISQAAGISYRGLIGEILACGLKRLREKRREAGLSVERTRQVGHGAAAGGTLLGEAGILDGAARILDTD